MDHQVEVSSESHYKALIVGGNFAGISAAKQLVAMNQGDMDIYLIDPSDDFNWTPNIHEILSGVKQPNRVEISRQELLAGLPVTLIQDKVVRLATEDKQVYLGSGAVLDFDACLIACGYQAIPAENTGVGFHFRSAKEVAKIAKAIADVRAKQDQLRITLVGGGFTGVEVLGELLRQYSSLKGLDIKVIEGGSRLLNNLPAQISSDILKLTEPYPVEFYFNRRLQDSSDGYVSLSDGTSFRSDITIFTTGGKLPPFVYQAGLAQPDDLGIGVDPCLQSRTSSACFVAGDAADFVWQGQSKLSKQSYHALDLGQAAALNMVNWLRGVKLQNFSPKAKPMLLSFGDLNTYMISGETVLASPLLAASKEAIYQLNMYKLSASMSLIKRNCDLVGRCVDATKSLLLPELSATIGLKIMRRSRVLKYGSAKDLTPLLRGLHSTLFDAI